jgi:tRNA (guanine-N7-)-methyltransferase
MGQKKLVRFEEIRHFKNVLEYPENMAGKWNEFFGNDSPIVLELACGKGEYAVGLGEMYAEKNFIGVDIKGNRIWRGAKTAIEKNLNNVAFLRTEIDKIVTYFSSGEVSDIWITFPDPQLRTSKAKKRLTHPKFLRLYQQILKKEGTINLKTDSPALYQFTKTAIDLYGLELLEDLDDVYHSPGRSKELEIKTHYEKLDIAGSNKVHYLRFGLNTSLPVEKDLILKTIIGEQENAG